MISSIVNRFDVLLTSLLILASFADANRVDHLWHEAQPVILSTPHECLRPCIDGAPPKTCYYHFYVESYVTMGRACDYCLPNITNQLNATCQCVTGNGIERAVLTINRMIPGPSIQVCKGDHVVIDVENAMDAKATSIHWHGIFQQGTQYYDGVPFVTQCPFADGNTFRQIKFTDATFLCVPDALPNIPLNLQRHLRYHWYAVNDGTQLWHAHHGSQRIDGLYGSIVIRVPYPLHRNLYDYDRPEDVIVLSDWFHSSGSEYWPGRLHFVPGQGAEAQLIQGLGQYTNPYNGSTTSTPMAVFKVQPGKRYRFRMINACTTVCPSEFSIEGHVLTLIASDAADIQPTYVDSILSTAGERYDFVLETYNNIERSWWIRTRALSDCTNTSVQQFAILHYDGAPRFPSTPKPPYNVDFFGSGIQDLFGTQYGANKPKPVVGGIIATAFRASDTSDNDTNSDFDFREIKNARPVDEAIRGVPDIQVVVPFSLMPLDDDTAWTPNTYQRFAVTPERYTIAAGIGTISHVTPTSPLLSQIEDIEPGTFCNQTHLPNTTSGINRCTHVVNIPLGSLVEIVNIDLTKGAYLYHPMHLHGYQYYVLALGTNPDPVRYPDFNETVFQYFDNQGLIPRNFVDPPLKDTTTLPGRGYTIMRFRANNPGYWLLHCHFDYHMLNGMQMILHVGEQNDLPPVPPEFPKCKNYKPNINSMH